MSSSNSESPSANEKGGQPPEPTGARFQESPDGQPREVHGMENEQKRTAEREGDDEAAMSVPDATLRPFVRALLALALELQELETERT